MSFQIGDKVVCVPAPKKVNYRLSAPDGRPEVGQIYVVKGLYQLPHFTGPRLVLVGLRCLEDGVREIGFARKRFRKLEELKMESRAKQSAQQPQHAE